MTSPLVSTTELAESLSGAEPPVVVDVRWRLGGPPGRADYVRGHLPGAVFLDLDADLAAPPGPAGRHPLPDAADLQRVLRAAGVREGGPVVVYDADNGSVAARLWWLLRWAGHDRVRVLDGGYAAWAAEGCPVTTDVPTPALGDVTVRPGRMPVVDADGAAVLARTGVLLDARAPERYRGDVEPIDPKAGHVPGARNAPFAAHTGDDGRWRAPADLTAHFAKAGVPTRTSTAEATASAGKHRTDDAGARAGVTEGAGKRWTGGARERVGEYRTGEASGRAEATASAVEYRTGGAGGRVGETERAGEHLTGDPGGRAEESDGAGETRSLRQRGSSGETAPEVGVYCGSGVTATSVVLALEVAGIRSADAPAILYAGSWSNWSADPARPVATGDTPGR